MSKEELGVGFIGVGTVTQAIHLPTPARLIDLFGGAPGLRRVVADVATGVTARTGARSSNSLENVLTDEAVMSWRFAAGHLLESQRSRSVTPWSSSDRPTSSHS